MAATFHELPLEVFNQEARPYIARLNKELRDLFGLEGTIRQPRSASRSDQSVARGEALQVHTSRITPSIASVVAGVSTAVGTPALTFGLTNTVGSSTTAVSVNSAVALFDTTAPAGLAETAAAGTAAFAARRDHVHAGFTASTPGAIGSTAASGTADYASRIDHQHLYPAALRSTANASTVTLTDDGSAQTLTSTLGALNIQLPDSSTGSLVIKPSASGSGAANVVSLQIRPSIGNRTGIASAFFGGATLSGVTLRAWDGQFSSVANNQTSVEYYGFDNSIFAFAPTAGSGAGNIAYGARFLGPTITTATGSWTDVGSLRLKRAIKGNPFANPTVPLGYGIRFEMPNLGTTDQIGILLEDITDPTEHTPTNRIGMDIPAMRKGTLRIGARIAVDASTSANVHLNLVDKTADPAAPNAGDIWRNSNSLYFKTSVRKENLIPSFARTMMLATA